MGLVLKLVEVGRKGLVSLTGFICSPAWALSSNKGVRQCFFLGFSDTTFLPRL